MEQQNQEKKSYLRRAGQYQDEKIDDLFLDEAMPYITVILAFLAIIVFVWLLWFFPLLRNPFQITIVFFLPIPYYIWKIIKVRRQIVKHRRGSLGEKVVADELEKIKRHGYMVIHDFQHKRLGNIDHIVIGPKGVFVLETKFRSNPENEDRIFFDGENVYNLNILGDKTKITNDKGRTPCDQAAWAAAELQKMLQTDFPGVRYVQPVVVFPFWKIEMKYDNTQRVRVRVSDEKELHKQFIGRDDYFSDEDVIKIYEYLAEQNKRNNRSI